MDSTKNYGPIIAGLIFAAGFILGDFYRQKKVADAVHELYEEGGYVVVPDNRDDFIEVEYMEVK